MGNIFFWHWEEQYLVWLQNLGNDSALQTVLLALNNFFSFLGEQTICIVIMGLIYWGISKEKGLRIGFSVAMTNVSNGMIKNIFCRIRPHLALESIHLLRPIEGYSFPSGHSANSACIYPGVAYEFRKKEWTKWFKYLAIAIPILVAVSRNYLGAHWPTDVIVGLLQGILFLTLIEFLFAKIQNRIIIYISLLLVSSAGLFYCTTDDFFSSYGLIIGAVAGNLFEQKYVKFENTTKWYFCLSRTLMGGVLYGIINPSLKALFSLFCETGSYGSLLLRSLRYALVVFLLFGVYPYLFRYENKLRKKS